MLIGGVIITLRQLTTYPARLDLPYRENKISEHDDEVNTIFLWITILLNVHTHTCNSLTNIYTTSTYDLISTSNSFGARQPLSLPRSQKHRADHTKSPPVQRQTHTHTHTHTHDPWLSHACTSAYIYTTTSRHRRTKYENPNARCSLPFARSNLPKDNAALARVSLTEGIRQRRSCSERESDFGVRLATTEQGISIRTWRKRVGIKRGKRTGGDRKSKWKWERERDIKDGSGLHSCFWNWLSRRKRTGGDLLFHDEGIFMAADCVIWLNGIMWEGVVGVMRTVCTLQMDGDVSSIIGWTIKNEGRIMWVLEWCILNSGSIRAYEFKLERRASN